jgi:Skp family chaperone for outer membrane proteins
MNRSPLLITFLCIVGIAAFAVAQNADRQDPHAQGTASADPGGSGHIAVLDLVRVFEECAQIKDLNDAIRRRDDEIKQEASQRQASIEKKQMELTAFEPGTPDYESRRKDLLQRNIDANVWFKFSQEDMERQKFEWTQIIYEKAVAVAAQLASERGLTAVLQRSVFNPAEVAPSVQGIRRMIHEQNVIYHQPEIDITDEVIRRLDAGYKAAAAKGAGTANQPGQ